MRYRLKSWKVKKKIKMTTSRKYLSMKDLRERESILTEELRMIREEIQRREESGNDAPPLWNADVPNNFMFPHEISKRDEEEVSESIKKANEPNKALILLAKAKIEAGLTETILQKQKKKIIPKPSSSEENE